MRCVLFLSVLPALGCATARPAWVDLAAGNFHTCALDRNGKAHCWGANHAGELGHGGTDARLVPTPVLTEARFVDLTASEASTCGLDEDGVAWCWGVRKGGEKRREKVLVPTAVTAPVPFVDLSAHSGVACALDKKGGLWCWGRRQDGRLGLPLEGRTPEAVRVVEAPPLKEVEVASNTACGRDRNGQVWCWGRFGQATLGDGEVHDPAVVPVPQQVTLDQPAEALSESIGWTWCALLEDGEARCWGDASADMFPGEVEGRRALSPQPTQLPAMQQISVGFSMACGTTTEGEAWCWGSDRTFSSPRWGGALGRGEVLNTRKNDGARGPAPVQTDLRFLQVVAGEDHACGRTREGTVHCWGHDAIGQLGQGTPDAGAWPAPAVKTTAFGLELTDIVLGETTSCGADADGAVVCWPQIPLIRSDQPVPEEPTALGDGGPLTSLSVGRRHACALNAEGSPVCLFADFDRRRRRWSMTPWAVPGVSGLGGLEVTSRGLCAFETDTRRMRCWRPQRDGSVKEAETPQGTWPEPDAETPTRGCDLDEQGRVGCYSRKEGRTLVDGLGAMEQVTVAGFGQDTHCARDAEGVVRCWGRNSNGALGRPTDAWEDPVPTPIEGPRLRHIAGMRADIIRGSDAITWGVDEAGVLYAWGCERPAARPIPGVPPLTRVLTAGSRLPTTAFGACGRTTSGELTCWTFPDDFTCGAGQPTPVQVPLPDPGR